MKRRLNSRACAEERNYFSAELVPGFPFQEFEKNDVADDDDLSTYIFAAQPHPAVSGRFLTLLKSMPTEIREHIYRCIIPLGNKLTKRCNPPAVKSRHLMRDYTAIPDNHYHPPGTPKDSGFAPVKYSLRVPPTRISPRLQALLLHSVQLQKITTVSEDPCTNGGTYNLMTLISLIGDVHKVAKGDLKMVENDYHAVRLCEEYSLFVKGLIKAEGFFYVNKKAKAGAGKWRSENMDKSVLKEFLKWFWKNFILDFTCDYTACSHWVYDNLKSPRFIRQWHLIQNITMDILGSAYNYGPHTTSLGGDNTSILNLPFLCERLSRLSQIQNLTIYFWVQRRDIKDLIDNPGRYEWIKYIREIRVSKTFALELKVIGMIETETIDCREREKKYEEQKKLDNLKLHAVWQEKLRILMMPETLNSERNDR
ncbi:hypothetical protein ACMFMG_009532 [Clarireedia jacksonii]